MTFVSITRLRLRSLRFLPPFAIHALKTTQQARRAPGFIGGSVLPDRQLAFWTMTLWHEQADMRRYMVSGDHLVVMPKLLHWCDEASMVNWSQDSADVPDWQDADRRMRSEGRPSKVRHPSIDHQGLNYRAPRLTAAAPLKPR